MSEMDTLAELAMGSQSKRRPKRYHSLVPALTDIRFTYDLLNDRLVEMLDDAEFRTLMRLAAYSASGRVWTYSEPGDGAVPIAASGMIRNYLRLTPRKWEKIRTTLLKYGLIKIEDGKIYLKDSFVVIGDSEGDRPMMPPSLRMAILNRDKFTCGYCGSAQGPFDVDHIVPWSRGGSFASEDNLICACAPCNRGKGAKTVEEWLG